MKAKILLASVVAATVVMTGCASNPYNNTTQTQRSVLGGAALGAAIGALSRTDGGNSSEIAEAAAIGAVAGAGAGYASTKIGN